MQTGYSVFIPSSILFVKKNKGRIMWFYVLYWCCYTLVLSWFKFCSCHALIHHSSAAHKSHFGTSFYGYLTGFST